MHLKIGYKAQRVRATGAPYIDVSRLPLVCWAHCSASASGLTQEETIDGWIRFERFSNSGNTGVFSRRLVKSNAAQGPTHAVFLNENEMVIKKKKIQLTFDTEFDKNAALELAALLTLAPSEAAPQLAPALVHEALTF